MGDTYESLVYFFIVRRINNKSRRSYVSFVDVYFEIEFADACSSKLVISLRKVDILRIKVEDLKKTCL